MEIQTNKLIICYCSVFILILLSIVYFYFIVFYNALFFGSIESETYIREMYLMKFRKLGLLGLSSFIILSACGQNTEDNDKKDNNKAHEKDKKSDQTENQSNDEVAENNQNTKNQSQGESNAAKTTNETNNQNSEPVTIDEAKSIAYQVQNLRGYVQNKEELIYNKEQSNDDQIFIETPFGGLNMSGKQHAIIDKKTGEIIKTGGGTTHPDGPIKAKNGYIDKDIYNIAADFYNTYVYKQGMPKYEPASSDVPEAKYKKLSKLLNSYRNEQMNKENKSDNNKQSSNEHSSNKENDKNSDQKQKPKEKQNNKNNTSSNKNDENGITAQEAEDIVYDWYKNTDYGLRLRDEFHVNTDKSNDSMYYVDFSASDARGHPINSQATVDKTTKEIIDITYLSSHDPEVDKRLPKKETK